MRIRLLASAFLLATFWPAAAQLLVEVTLEQNQFLPGETVPATVRISNRSGRTLQMGKDEDWLTFAVEGRRGSSVHKLGEVPVLGEFTLESSRVAVKKVDLAPYFTLTRPGRYGIVATVRIKEWDSLASSPPKSFDVIEGVKMWFQDFGVPAAVDAGQPPEVRRFALLRANYLRSALRLYCRVSDASDEKVLKVFPLGEVVSFGKPEARVDGESRLHVLHQNGAHSSRYTVINADGEVVLRQLYDYVEGRPQLGLDREGKIGVLGAVRRPDGNDVPAPKPRN